MEKLNESRMMIIIHVIVGITVGYFSFLIENGWYSFGLAVLILLGLGFILEKVVIREKRGVKWWMANGGMIYFFVWIITWTVLFNL